MLFGRCNIERKSALARTRTGYMNSWYPGQNKNKKKKNYGVPYSKIIDNVKIETAEY